MDRRRWLGAGASIAGLAALPRAVAAGWPDRPVRIISSYAAGGGPDVQLRELAQVLGGVLGQSIIVENKVGAGGVLAAQYGAAAAPDGYVLCMGSNIQLVQKMLQPDLHFDALVDFTPVSNFASSPTVLVVSADQPVRSVAELLAALRAKPGATNYSSGGIGTSAHLAGATFVSLNHLAVTHIPLKGSVEITSSLIRGDTQFAFPIAGTAVPQINGGKLRALAVTSRKRLPSLPDVPTLVETLDNELFVQESWFGIWAPAKTPADVVAKAHAAIVKSLADPTVRAQFEAAGNVAVPSESPAAFGAFMQAENAKWAQIVKLANITAT